MQISYGFRCKFFFFYCFRFSSLTLESVKHAQFFSADPPRVRTGKSAPLAVRDTSTSPRAPPRRPTQARPHHGVRAQSACKRKESSGGAASPSLVRSSEASAQCGFRAWRRRPTEGRGEARALRGGCRGARVVQVRGSDDCSAYHPPATPHPTPRLAPRVRPSPKVQHTTPCPTIPTTPCPTIPTITNGSPTPLSTRFHSPPNSYHFLQRSNGGSGSDLYRLGQNRHGPGPRYRRGWSASPASGQSL